LEGRLAQVDERLGELRIGYRSIKSAKYGSYTRIRSESINLEVAGLAVFGGLDFDER
jgi:hypothetical protein